jgi:MFS family permease
MSAQICEIRFAHRKCLIHFSSIRTSGARCCGRVASAWFGHGFFADAYDPFVVGVVSSLIKLQRQLGSGWLALLNATMLGAAFLGALVFAGVADLVGRKRKKLVTGVTASVA